MSSKTIVRLSFLFLLIVGAFLFGRWAGSLNESLDAEKNYPWELHQKIGDAGIDCGKLLKPSTGRFYLRPLDDGRVLVAASLDSQKSMVSAFAIDLTGHVAADSWPIDCVN